MSKQSILLSLIFNKQAPDFKIGRLLRYRVLFCYHNRHISAYASAVRFYLCAKLRTYFSTFADICKCAHTRQLYAVQIVEKRLLEFSKHHKFRAILLKPKVGINIAYNLYRINHYEKRHEHA